MRTGQAPIASSTCNVLLVYPRFAGEDILEFRGGLRDFRRQLSDLAARPDHRRCDAATRMEHAPRDRNVEELTRQRHRLG